MFFNFNEYSSIKDSNTVYRVYIYTLINIIPWVYIGDINVYISL